jgi:GH15 family glucan-1,4-alpha-glucosidase
MGYQPIERYGIIGNMLTTALVGCNGSIDWFCFPHHDSPSVFGAILDDKKGGHFSISSRVEGVTDKQFYWPETNVLVTRFLAPCGVGEVLDFMPVGVSPEERGYHWLLRIVRCIRRSMPFRLECYPGFNYARDAHDTQLNDSGAFFRSDRQSMGLITDVPLQADERGVTAEFTLQYGQSAVFMLQEIDHDTRFVQPVSPPEANDLFEHTVNYWRRWLSQCTYRGRWRGMIERSALALKLMTYEPTGAIVAAPTCGLPEQIGGSRNWDYRYTWIRDAAFTVYALLRIGFQQEAAQFMNWIEDRCHELEGDSILQPVYRIDGGHDLAEEELTHLEGYMGSGPVRIGNSAHKQFQLDVYGELLDSAYLFNKYGTYIAFDSWQQLRKLTNWVCEHWEYPDEGVWESRGTKEQFVYSKLMCWVAIDRALRIANKRSFPADRTRWETVRDRIYEDIMAKGWNEKRQAFTRYYGSDSLDASNLIMPLVFFVSATDPKMLKTIDTMRQPPSEGGLVSNSLVYRYNQAHSDDGLTGKEGTFNLCSFWLVEALTRAGRTHPEQLDQARLMFEEILSYTNHVGLYAEETGSSGQALGNFPQALTHLSLISAAWNLNRALTE